MAVNIMLVPSVDYNRSKSETLSAVVADKLTSASQEILVVVQRTVAGFEDEISALRSEITRQRHQLELLQPRITLCRPVEAVRVEAGGGEAPKEEKQTDVEDSDPFEEDEDKQDEEEPVVHQGDAQTPELSDPVRKRRKAGRKKSDFVKLRVCLLGNTDSLRKGLLKSGVQELRCPPGLSEEDFLLLLRSSFPRLRLPVDAMTADPSQRLQTLELKSLTPEEIQRSVGAVGRGRSALYLRERRSANNSQDTEQLPVPGRKDNVTHETGSDENRPNTSSHYSPAENMQSDEADNLTQQQETDEDGEKPGRSEAEEGGDGEDGDEGEEDDGDEGEEDDGDEGEEDDGEDGDEGEEDDGEDGDEGDEGEEDDGDKEWKPEESDDGEKELGGEASGVKTKRRKETVGAPLACKVCGALRGSLNMLIKHSWGHVHEQESVCGVCGENVEDLKHHLKTHQKTLEDCDICGKSFLTAGSRDKHALLHTGEKPYECDVCHKAYVLKSSLKAHRWEHVQEKPHKCQVCNRSFAFSHLLTIHSSSHTGEKPYTCDVCGKSLFDLRSLSRHKLTHSGEKRYVCQVCGKRFLLPENLKGHSKRIHTARDKTHLCDVCCKTFHSLPQLKVHLKTHSGDKILCQECGKGLSSRGALRRHMVIHTGEKPHKCSECGRTFNALSILRGHMKTHSGVKPFVCNICGKVCARKEHLTVHMRLHNGEKPYKCIVCEKAFTQSHCLKTHMKNHRGEEETAADAITS
ncbi:zinc finger protein 852-like isoform X1 [Pseudochaenichthys georgianus]|uniref:zinc finger protein 852-like isoform X1 n=1 Tax=Pseudochaenichthys georgianus TaxID=52239 RepID=UPI0039C09076